MAMSIRGENTRSRHAQTLGYPRRRALVCSLGEAVALSVAGGLAGSCDRRLAHKGDRPLSVCNRAFCSVLECLPNDGHCPCNRAFVGFL